VDGCRAARAGLFVNHAGAGLEVHVDEFESIRNRQTGDLTPRCCLLEQCHHSCSLDALITLGAELGCGFTVEDLQESMELSDEELEIVAGGIDGGAAENMMAAWDGRRGFSFAELGTGRWSLVPTWMPGC